MMVYIASDKPLEMRPWSEEEPAFCVLELPERDGAVKAQFERGHVYYAGSHEGCGCGFQLGEYPDFECEDREERRRTLAQFSEYLARALEAVDELELFACWDGDQGAAPEHQRHLTPESLLADTFFFLEKERSRIRASGERWARPTGCVPFPRQG